MTKGKITIELDYRDFYALLELTGTNRSNEFLTGIYERLLHKVFEKAAQYKEEAEWTLPGPTTHDAMQAVYDLRGRSTNRTEKIRAIKFIREIAGLSLFHAKEYVDSLSGSNSDNEWTVLGSTVTFSTLEQLYTMTDISGYHWQVRKREVNDDQS